MKKNNRLQTVLAVVAIFAFSSCNRGYGCPYNSMDEIFELATQFVSTFLF